jgi:cobalt-zinc-cadmium efflux system membrane fusion protein
LKIEAVRSAGFDSVLNADGVVGGNDNASVAVYSPFSGRVTAVHALLGQTVRRGAPLATVLATETAQADSDLAAADAAEASARQQLDLARSTEQRQHELLLAEAGAQKDWQQSQSDLAVAKNTLRAAQAAMATARAKAAILGVASTTHAGGQGVISTPIDGVVLQRQVAPGQFVNSLTSGGATALFTIADLRTVWVLANVAEVDAQQLQLGQRVDIAALAFPQRSWHARVTWIAATVDPATHRIAVRAELPNADQALKPQMTVAVRLHAGTLTQSIAIPRSAVVYEGTDAHGFVVTGQRTLALRELKLGRTQGALIEVTSGLSGADRIVTHGALFVDRAAEDSTP